VAKQPNPQTEKFKAVARALGCNESEEHFDAALAKVTQHKAVRKPPIAKQSKGPLSSK
jgi:hypothetical protein